VIGGYESLPLALALLVAMEAGVPIPVPSDLVVLLVGERAAAGAFSLGAAVAVVELAAVVGTTALFFAFRSAARPLRRIGPRVGLTQERLGRATSLLETRGRPAIVLGRATPGLRTVTVAAASVTTLASVPVLALLILGSTFFLQMHLVLGFLFGAAARGVLERVQGPVGAALVVVAIVGLVVIVARRGPRSGARAWTEASCPVCTAVTVFTSGEKNHERIR
jgi:membrane protein DedA with SNARE-associated domain